MHSFVKLLILLYLAAESWLHLDILYNKCYNYVHRCDDTVVKEIALLIIIHLPQEALIDMPFARGETFRKTWNSTTCHAEQVFFVPSCHISSVCHAVIVSYITLYFFVFQDKKAPDIRGGIPHISGAIGQYETFWNCCVLLRGVNQTR